MSRARLVKSNRMQTWRFQAWSLETHWILERFTNESLNSGTELDICGPKVLNSSRFIKHWRFVKTTSLGLNQKSEQLRSRTKAGLSGCIRGRPSDVDFKMISKKCVQNISNKSTLNQQYISDHLNSSKTFRLSPCLFLCVSPKSFSQIFLGGSQLASHFRTMSHVRSWKLSCSDCRFQLGWMDIGWLMSEKTIKCTHHQIIPCNKNIYNYT